MFWVSGTGFDIEYNERSFPPEMLKNYIKIAWRNILKNRFYSLLNIAGLTAGITFTLLIASYVWAELRVNKDLNNADRQYILQCKSRDPNLGWQDESPSPLPKAMKEHYPDLIENYASAMGYSYILSNKTIKFREPVLICDSSLFDMFGFNFLQGDPRTALKNPFSIVIGTDVAIKYFGKTNVLGKVIMLSNDLGVKHPFLITGILGKTPKNSITFDNDLLQLTDEVFLSNLNLKFFDKTEDWTDTNAGYVTLKKGVKPEDLEKPMAYLIHQNASAELSANVKAFMIPLTSYYLDRNNHTVRNTILALTAIAFFILLMALINFMNISISRSGSRMREIGIRKVMGGLKLQLIIQFLSESIILVGLATLLSLLIYIGVRSEFSTIIQTTIPSLNSFPVYFVLIPLAIILVLGVLSGLYPAFILSSLKSVDSLKGKSGSVKDQAWLRKLLVGTQFGIATVAFVGSILISQQINLFFSKDLGYNKDYLVWLNTPSILTSQGFDHMELVRDRLAGMPQVADVSLSLSIPNGGWIDHASFWKPGSDSSRAIESQSIITDEYFASTYAIPMKAGVFLGMPGDRTDSLKMVINESESRALGWNDPHEALGKRLLTNYDSRVFTISGVVKDFHLESMQSPIKPVGILSIRAFKQYGRFSIKLKPGNIQESLAAIQKEWQNQLPDAPFVIHFMDITLEQVYKKELQLKQATYIASFLSFIIVLLGIIGLVSISIQKRKKEIAIRRVLGSSVESIISLFIRETLPTVLIAGLIACPVAYILIRNWLDDYAYQIAVTPAAFIISIMGLSLVSTLLISLQTFKTAQLNPVDSLRAE